MRLPPAPSPCPPARLKVAPSGPNHMLLRVTALLSVNSAQNWVKGWQPLHRTSDQSCKTQAHVSRFNLHLVYMPGNNTWVLCLWHLVLPSDLNKVTQLKKTKTCWCVHTHTPCENLHNKIPELFVTVWRKLLLNALYLFHVFFWKSLSLCVIKREIPQRYLWYLL